MFCFISSKDLTYASGINLLSLYVVFNIKASVSLAKNCWYTQLALLTGLNDNIIWLLGFGLLSLKLSCVKSSNVISVASSIQISLMSVIDFIFSLSSKPLNKKTLPLGNVISNVDLLTWQ